MRAAHYYLATLRQAPADAEIISHQLLLRGGFIRPLAAGMFSYLPLGLRVLRKVEEVIRQEMNAAGALEVFLPVLHPRELWERTGRWDTFAPQPLRITDRTGREFCLGPTHEEVITDLVARDVASYKQLPLTLYQIQTKFRDEIRPRGGLIRAKEFIMKDAYSFDLDQEGLSRSYQAMYGAYIKIFERLDLPVTIVEAEAGSMGGSDTREFMALSEAGEDTIFVCSQCGYRANAECARVQGPVPLAPRERTSSPELVSTPRATTIEAVCSMLSRPAEQLVKTLLFSADGNFVAALVRGDRQLNVFKLANLLQCKELWMAEPAEILELTGAPVGFSGPVGLPAAVRIIADHEVGAMEDFVVGANQADAHLVGVNVNADFAPHQYADLREAMHGDQCDCCEEGHLEALRSIELGHVFKLGTRYSAALDAVVDDENGQQRPAVMGCYGIGVSRVVAALVEQHHDELGMVWPAEVAPFQVAVLLLDPDREDLATLAGTVAVDLEKAGHDVLVDDRNERPGVKFKDADLIGYPVRVVIGKRTTESGQLEVRRRRDGEELLVAAGAVVEAVESLLK